MIVDLVRNDLGRVCRAGTRARRPRSPRSAPHAGVWHMVSEVEGELRDGVGDADLLRATFPPGSVTGAPKLAALDVIAELESTGREAYTGAIGFASPLAGLELSVAIRTFEIRGTRIWLGAGGGIVADSGAGGRGARGGGQGRAAARGDRRRPAAPTAPRRSGARRPPQPVVARRGPRPVPRPDPAAGRLRDAARARDGVPQALARAPRAARGEPARALRRSRRRRRWPSGPRAAAAGQRARAGCGSTCVPGADAALARSRRPRPPAPVALRPVVVPGGIGPHKWRDRTAARVRTRPTTRPRCRCCSTPTGVVLETEPDERRGVRAGDGTRYTPPARRPHPAGRHRRGPRRAPARG